MHPVLLELLSPVLERPPRTGPVTLLLTISLVVLFLIRQTNSGTNKLIYTNLAISFENAMTDLHLHSFFSWPIMTRRTSSLVFDVFASIIVIGRAESTWTAMPFLTTTAVVCVGCGVLHLGLSIAAYARSGLYSSLEMCLSGLLPLCCSLIPRLQQAEGEGKHWWVGVWVTVLCSVVVTDNASLPVCCLFAFLLGWSYLRFWHVGPDGVPGARFEDSLALESFFPAAARPVLSKVFAVVWVAVGPFRSSTVYAPPLPTLSDYHLPLRSGVAGPSAAAAGAVAAAQPSAAAPGGAVSESERRRMKAMIALNKRLMEVPSETNSDWDSPKKDEAKV